MPLRLWVSSGAALRVAGKPPDYTALTNHLPAPGVPCVGMSDLERDFVFALTRENEPLGCQGLAERVPSTKLHKRSRHFQCKLGPTRG